MTIAETLARHSGVTERTARRWIASGREEVREPGVWVSVIRSLDRIVADLREQGPMRTPQIAARHGLHERTARRYMRRLWIDARVRPVGSWDWEAA